MKRKSLRLVSGAAWAVLESLQLCKGPVTDPSGAVVAPAKITVTQTGARLASKLARNPLHSQSDPLCENLEPAVRLSRLLDQILPFDELQGPCPASPDHDRVSGK